MFEERTSESSDVFLGAPFFESYDVKFFKRSLGLLEKLYLLLCQLLWLPSFHCWKKAPVTLTTSSPMFFQAITSTVD